MTMKKCRKAELKWTSSSDIEQNVCVTDRHVAFTQRTRGLSSEIRCPLVRGQSARLCVPTRPVEEHAGCSSVDKSGGVSFFFSSSSVFWFSLFRLSPPPPPWGHFCFWHYFPEGWSAEQDLVAAKEKGLLHWQAIGAAFRDRLRRSRFRLFFFFCSGETKCTWTQRVSPVHTLHNNV